jgi:hypothetical protein
LEFPREPGSQTSQELGGIDGRLVTRNLDQLSPHPSYARHGLSVQPFKLAALAELGELAFQHPIVITRDGLIMDGYARWELAKAKGRPTLLCLEYEFTVEQALEWLIQMHHSSHGFCAFIRIELALELEPYFQKKATLNQQAGAREKGSSKLTIAEKVNSRKEVARLAHASLGNVHKVKHILAQGCRSLQEAVRSEEISINLADMWSDSTEAEQQERLRVLRIERGIRKKARQLVAAKRVEASCPADERVFSVLDLVRLMNQLTNIDPQQVNEVGSIEINVISGCGREIFVTEKFIEALTQQLEGPIA